nr:MAG TPA: hypothetical protein [Caudoviricetes sp.]
MSHRNRMKMTCKDELVVIIEPPQEIKVVIEKVEIVKLDDGQCDQKIPTLEELKAFYNIGAL